MKKFLLCVLLLLGIENLFSQHTSLRNDTIYFYELSESEILKVINNRENEVFDNQFFNRPVFAKKLHHQNIDFSSHKYFISFSYPNFTKEYQFYFPEEIKTSFTDIQNQLIVFATDERGKRLETLKLILENSVIELTKTEFGFIIPADVKGKNFLLKSGDLVKIIPDSETRIYSKPKKRSNKNYKTKNIEQFILCTHLPIYAQGDTLKFKGAFLKRNHFIKRKMNLKISTINNQVYYHSKIKPDKKGNYFGKIVLPDTMPLNQIYNLTLTNRNVYSSVSFNYKNYELAKNQLLVNYKFNSIFQDSIAVSIQFVDAFGQNLPNSKIYVSLIGSNHEYILENKQIVKFNPLKYSDTLNLDTNKIVTKSYSVKQLTQQGGKIELIVDAVDVASEIINFYKTIKILPTAEFLESSIIGDSLRCDFYSNKNLKKVKALLAYKRINVNDISRQSDSTYVYLPHTFSLKSEKIPDAFIIDNKLFVVNVNFPSPIQFKFKNDSVYIDNFHNIVTNVKCISADKVVFDTIVSKTSRYYVNKNVNTTFLIKFIYKGVLNERSYSIQPNSQFLQIDTHLPDTLLSGSTVTGKIKVFDFKGKPVKNANLTLSSVDHKFENYSLGSSFNKFNSDSSFISFAQSHHYYKEENKPELFNSLYKKMSTNFKNASVQKPFIITQNLPDTCTYSLVKFFILKHDTLVPYQYVLSDSVIKFVNHSADEFIIKEQIGLHNYTIRIYDEIIKTDTIFIKPKAINYIVINIDSVKLQKTNAGKFTPNEIRFLGKNVLKQVGSRYYDYLYFGKLLFNSQIPNELLGENFVKLPQKKIDSLLLKHNFKNDYTNRNHYILRDFATLYNLKLPKNDFDYSNKSVFIDDYARYSKTLFLISETDREVKTIFNDIDTTILKSGQLIDVSGYKKVYFPDYNQTIVLDSTFTVVNFSINSKNICPVYNFSTPVESADGLDFQHSSYYYKPTIQLNKILNSRNGMGGFLRYGEKLKHYSYTFIAPKFINDPINKFSGMGYMLGLKRQVKPARAWNLNVSYNHLLTKEYVGKDVKYVNLSFDNTFDFPENNNRYEKRHKHVAFLSIGVGNNIRLNKGPNSIANAYNFMVNPGVGYRYKLAKNWDLNLWAKYPLRVTHLHDDKILDKFWDVSLSLSFIPPLKVICPKFRYESNDDESRSFQKNKTLVQTQENQNDFVLQENPNMVRENFSYSGTCVPNLITDKNGEASFSVKYPDNITKWNNHVAVLTKKGQSQSVKTETNAIKLDYLVTNWPKYVVKGDTFEPNYYIRSKKSNLATKLFQENKPSHLLVAKDSVLVSQLNLLDSSQTILDAEKIKIPVYAPEIAIGKSQFIKINKDTTLIFDLINKKNFKLKTVSSINDYLKIYAEYLNEYDGGCGEQLSSRLLAATYSNIDADKLIKKLEQKFDSNIGIYWWNSNLKPNYDLSAYALLAFKSNLKSQKNTIVGELETFVKTNFDSLSTFYKWMLVEDKIIDATKIQLNKKDSSSTENALYSTRIAYLKNRKEYSNLDFEFLLKTCFKNQQAHLYVLDWEQTELKKLVFVLKLKSIGYWLSENQINNLTEKVSQHVFELNKQNITTFDRGLLLWANLKNKNNSLTASKAILKKTYSNNQLKIDLSNYSGYLHITYDSVSTLKNQLSELKIQSQFEGNVLKDSKFNYNIKVQSAETYKYMLLKIPIPSGCKLLNVKNSNQYQIDNDVLKVYLNTLSKGEHEFIVELFAETKGHFNVKPVQIQNMYYESLEVHEGLKSLRVE